MLQPEVEAVLEMLIAERGAVQNITDGTRRDLAHFTAFIKETSAPPPPCPLSLLSKSPVTLSIFLNRVMKQRPSPAVYRLCVNFTNSAFPKVGQSIIPQRPLMRPVPNVPCLKFYQKRRSFIDWTLPVRRPVPKEVAFTLCSRPSMPAPCVLVNWRHHPGDAIHKTREDL